MTSQAPPGSFLGSRFAREFPELGVPWEAGSAPDPRLLVLNEALASELGLDPQHLRSSEGARLLVGNDVPDDAKPVAQAYAGHQFGNFVPRLGDGRALLLGELPDGRDLHLKGSGRTPFARGGDGLAAVGPMLREYLVSEALHALGVPTTRSLAVVATGKTVSRETLLPGAVLARVAASHLRVGTFQYARATGDVELLRRLADHAIALHHPHAASAENPYLELFDAVLAAQASLMAQWMLVGFVHGVMNTDNTTLSGETIDYGPCAFMDAFDPATVFSSIDVQGRYAYGNQPGIAQWNLARFAETLIPLVHSDEQQAVELLTSALETFPDRYIAAWEVGMRDKLGLPAHIEDSAAKSMIDDVITLLDSSRVDYTLFFRHLTSAARGDEKPLRDLTGHDVDAWLERWQKLSPAAESMQRVNPVYIPRNHLVEQALDAATAGDLAPFEKLVDVITRPFTERPGLEHFEQPAPQDAAPHVTYCGT